MFVWFTEIVFYNTEHPVIVKEKLGQEDSRIQGAEGSRDLEFRNFGIWREQAYPSALCLSKSEVKGIWMETN